MVQRDAGQTGLKALMPPSHSALKLAHLSAGPSGRALEGFVHEVFLPVKDQRSLVSLSRVGEQGGGSREVSLGLGLEGLSLLGVLPSFSPAGRVCVCQSPPPPPLRWVRAPCAQVGGRAARNWGRDAGSCSRVAAKCFERGADEGGLQRGGPEQAQAPGEGGLSRGPPVPRRRVLSCWCLRGAPSLSKPLDGLCHISQDVL